MLLQNVLPSVCLVSIIQVNTVPTLGWLIFDYRHVFGIRIAWGGEGGLLLEPARTGRLPPILIGLASGFAFYYFSIMA